MKVAVASGKGGTGKTTVACNLARVAPQGTTLLDCDVEEPNVHLFLKGPTCDQHPVPLLVPEVVPGACTACGACASFCAFNALAVVPSGVMVFPELCHACGGCVRLCPHSALREVPRTIGTIEQYRSGGVQVVSGRLNIGEALAPPLVRAVRAGAAASGLIILDAPPGTACPVVATLRGCDRVVLVTEPTPFGLHDLTLAVDLVRDLGVEMGVVVNRHGSGDDRVQAYCNRKGIPVWLEIPDDRRVAEAYSRGELAVDAVPGYRERFEVLLGRVLAGGAA